MPLMTGVTPLDKKSAVPALMLYVLSPKVNVPPSPSVEMVDAPPDFTTVAPSVML